MFSQLRTLPGSFSRPCKREPSRKPLHTFCHVSQANFEMHFGLYETPVTRRNGCSTILMATRWGQNNFPDHVLLVGRRAGACCCCLVCSCCLSLLLRLSHSSVCSMSRISRASSVSSLSLLVNFGFSHLPLSLLSNLHFSLSGLLFSPRFLALFTSSSLVGFFVSSFRLSPFILVPLALFSFFLVVPPACSPRSLRTRRFLIRHLPVSCLFLFFHLFLLFCGSLLSLFSLSSSILCSFSPGFSLLYSSFLPSQTSSTLAPFFLLRPPVSL